MNKYMLLVIKWLIYPDSVTIHERTENSNAANFAYAADPDPHPHPADFAVANAAANAAVDAVDAVEIRVNEYFELTGENKQDYIDAIEYRLSLLGSGPPAYLASLL